MEKYDEADKLIVDNKATESYQALIMLENGGDNSADIYWRLARASHLEGENAPEKEEQSKLATRAHEYAQKALAIKGSLPFFFFSSFPFSFFFPQMTMQTCKNGWQSPTDAWETLATPRQRSKTRF
jgi:hypothetical protein